MSDEVNASLPASNTAKLPPGMVLGPDGKPCKICSSLRSFRAARPSAKSATGAGLVAGGFANRLATSQPENDDPEKRYSSHCPPDVEQLGRATWTFLHTTAAYYPENPSANQRANMLTLLRALPVLYPCSHCAGHLKTNLEEHPPDVSGRARLSRWLCARHNDVNERLGKQTFDCDKVDERWKDGPADGSCG